jgi:hypothetical protein
VSGKPDFREVAASMFRNIEPGKEIVTVHRQRSIEFIAETLSVAYARGNSAGADAEMERVFGILSKAANTNRSVGMFQAAHALNLAAVEVMRRVPLSDTPAASPPGTPAGGTFAHERVELLEAGGVAGPSSGQAARGKDRDRA